MFFGLPCGSLLGNPLASARHARDAGSVPGSGRPHGGGNGDLLQYSCPENSMDKGVHGVTKSWK